MLDYHYLITFVFVIGYALIIFEHNVKINKAATALVTGVLCWMLFLEFDYADPEFKFAELTEHLASISQVVFFLIGAMTIVELIASHQGFDVLRGCISIKNPRKLFWVLLLLGFWMSSILDNLTSILVLVSLMRQIIPDHKTRQLYSAGLVFAVNVGGAWTPIGDITTTMLWIEERVNTIPLITNLFIPSILSLLFYGVLFTRILPKEDLKLIEENSKNKIPGMKVVLYYGILSLISIPILKLIFDLPPYMGMMLNLGVLWMITDRIHYVDEDRRTLRVSHILTKIDISCVMFFLGVLLGVAALESAGVLNWMAAEANNIFPNVYAFSFVIGILSAIVDNVPLVAGIIKMFDVSAVPADNIFWQLIAYCAGVGGSILIIGSAPGVALMSIKDIQFGWYLRKISGIALAGFLFGLGCIYIINILIFT